MKTLLILRHAKSSWATSMHDRQRPLNARGERDAPQMGDLLRDEDLIPDVIITSDAVRAHTTALAVAEAAGYAREVIVDPRLYLASPQNILAVLEEVLDADVSTALIVGHNPGLEELVEQLTGERHDLPTAALVQLALPIDAWTEIEGTTGAPIVNLWGPTGP